MIPIAIPISVKNNIPSCNKCHDTFDDIANKTIEHCEFKDACRTVLVMLSIPCCLLICSIGYWILVFIILLQKSESCTNFSMLSEFLKNNLCIMFLCCPIYYNSSVPDRDSECIICGGYRGNNLITGVPNTTNRSDKYCCNYTSYILCPFTIILLVFGFPLLIIGIVCYYILKFFKWIYTKIYTECTKSECSWSYCNCLDCCVISTTEPEQTTPVA